MIKEKDLPGGWEKVNLCNEDYFQILPSGINKFQGEKEYLSTESIKTDKIEKIECKITFNSRPSRANMQPVINSVWFAKMQSTLKVYLFDEENKNEANKYILSTGFAGIKVNEKLVFPKYLRFCLFTKQFNRAKDSLCSGATQKAIKNEKIRTIRILIPPLSTQKHIVSLLEKAESAKNLRKDADELTKDYLNALFLEMFGDPLRNTKKWDIKPLSEFGLIKTGNTPPRAKKEYYGDYIEWIKSDNINTPFTFLTKSEEMLSKEGAKVGRIAPKCSVLVSCIAGTLSCIGNVAIADRDVAFNQQINAIIPNNTVNEYFLYYLILNTKKHIQNSSTQSMKGMVSKSVFEKIEYICPSLPLQLKFSKIVEQVEKLKEYQKQSKKQIDGLFNALMQRAFKGELEV